MKQIRTLTALQFLPQDLPEMFPFGPKNQISEMHDEKFPDPSTSQCWKTSSKTDVCSYSSFPSEAMRWLEEVEVVDSVDDLGMSQSVRGHRFTNFEMLDAKIASSLKKIIPNSNFLKRVTLAEQIAQLDDRFFAEYRSLS